MRIWTKSTFRWRPDGTAELVPEESESFDYDGPVALCKDSPSPPPAPNYGQAAQQTAQSQMVSQYTPYGSQVYSPDPNSPSGFQSNITLTPQAQDTLNTQLGVSNKLGQLSTGAADTVANRGAFSLGSVPQIADQAYKNYTARLDPQWTQNTEMEDSKLANQGIVPGTKAYEDEMRVFNQGKNDAYTTANTAAINTMPQTYQLASAAYDQPLNELNAIRTGAQINNPQFSPQPAANMLGAAQAQGQYAGDVYNAQVGQQNATMQGLFGLGGAGLGAYGTYAGLAALSDVRLKKDIERVGEDPRGFGIHTFRYKWDKPYEAPRIGVMAQEVEKVVPEAVIDVGGVKAVDYGRIANA